MCDFEPAPRGTACPSWSIRPGFRLVSEHRQDKVPRFAEALPHQEGPRGSFGLEQCLSCRAGQMPMVPPKKEQERVRKEVEMQEVDALELMNEEQQHWARTREE